MTVVMEQRTSVLLTSRTLYWALGLGVEHRGRGHSIILDLHSELHSGVSVVESVEEVPSCRQIRHHI